MCDLDVMKARLMRLNRNMWWIEACDKPKLRTFIQIHDTDHTKILVHKNLKRNHRSLLAKLKCGVLPLKLEIGRYRNTPIENRLCIICDGNVLDDEIHFLYGCPGLSNVRNDFEGRVILPLALEDRQLLDILKDNLTDENIKAFGEFVEAMFERRRDLMYELLK